VIPGVRQSLESRSFSRRVAVALFVTFLAGCCRPIQRAPANPSSFGDKPTTGIIVRGTYPGIRPLCDSLAALFADIPTSMKRSDLWMVDDHVCGHGRTGCCLEVTWAYDSLGAAPSPLNRLQSWLKRNGWKYRTSNCFGEGPGISESNLERADLYCLLSESGGIGDLNDTLSIGDGLLFFRACFVPKDSTHAY